MGKRSVKENKSIFQLVREEAELTRAEASEKLEFISESRIEKYESGKSEVHPEEVVAMSKAYRRPELCNYYCSHMCPIGKVSVPEIEMRDLSQIVLHTLASLNKLNEQKDRFIDITSDSKISDNEMDDFVRIRHGIESIAEASASLNLWVSRMIASDKLDEERLKVAEDKFAKKGE